MAAIRHHPLTRLLCRKAFDFDGGSGGSQGGGDKQVDHRRGLAGHDDGWMIGKENMTLPSSP